jgi:hypothetical protein
MEEIPHQHAEIHAVERNSLPGIITDLWRIIQMEKSEGWTKANDFLLRKKLNQLFDIARQGGMDLR